MKMKRKYPKIKPKEPYYINSTGPDDKCKKCNRTYPETVLNREAMIHHKARGLECINVKSCRRAQRKLKG